jgi:hypothetical protein
MEACVIAALDKAMRENHGKHMNVWADVMPPNLARAAIRAMREPTKEMIGAEFVYKNCHMCGGASEQYPRMIDAASPQEE